MSSDARAVTAWAEAVTDHRESQAEAIGRLAFALVGKRGLAHVTMADLAHAAGISRPTLYKYAGSVEGALRGHIERETARYHAEVVAAVALETDPRAKLDAFIRVTLRHVGSDGHHGALGQVGGGTLSPAVEATVDAHAEGIRAMLAAILEEGKTAGVVRAEVNSGVVALLLQYVLVGAGRHQLVESDAARAAETAVSAFIWHGIGTAGVER